MANDSPASSTQTASSSFFNRWQGRFSSITGLGVTDEEKARRLQEGQHQLCEKWKSEMLNYSPAVVFMMKHLKASGCNVTPEHLVCLPCSQQQRSGGFVPAAGAVALCQDGFVHKAHMESTIVHELIHMYDQCKFKVDWNNLRHHACSEIRANSLSGDCRFKREFADRLQMGFSKQHQACVRRRAVVSVRANPACLDDETAERAVNEVWESCFNDTRPFDEIY